jgi:Nif-specific regulatory protein
MSAPRNAASFTEDDMRLLAAIGSIGGLSLQRLQHLDWLRGENARLRQDVAIEHSLVGESTAMQAVYRFIARAASTDATVLLSGESGTGKELVAHAIHTNSRRAHGPFVAINCAALPDALLESELFGHERGAFTGAIAQQRGRLEMADRGTVFLDEIGELAPPLQAKLLRVLEDHVVERIGARRGIKIDVRVNSRGRLRHRCPTGYHAQVAANKREIIREALERSSGNVARTARALDLQPTYLHRLIRNLGLRDESTREEPTA